MAERRDTVIITGSSGFIGEALLNKLAASFRVIGLDLSPPQRLPSTARFEEIDLTSDESVDRVFAKIGKPRRGRIASVIHLAAWERRRVLPLRRALWPQVREKDH